jgi:hypothetical protein
MFSPDWSFAPLFHGALLLLFLVVFGEASLSKFFDRTTPEWFVEKYRSTWMGRLPAPLLWWSIAVFEVVTAAAFLLALVMREPVTGEQMWTELALLLAFLVFTALCFGLRVAQDYAGAANAFFYATLTALVWAVVLP